MFIYLWQHTVGTNSHLLFIKLYVSIKQRSYFKIFRMTLHLSRCDKVVRIPGYLNIISQIITTGLFCGYFSFCLLTQESLVFLSLRTYALYHKENWILVLTLSFGCIVTGFLGVRSLRRRHEFIFTDIS